MKSKPAKATYVDSSPIESWSEGLKKTKNVPKTFRSIELGLRSALEEMQDLKGNKGPSKKSNSAENFNKIIKFCLSHVSPAIHKLFKMNSDTDKPIKTTKTATLNPIMRNYLKSIILLSRSMTDPSASMVIISKGILPLLPFYCEHAKVAILLVKHLSTLWSTSLEEKVQVLAFMAIFRLTRSSSQEILEHVMKLLYTCYASNCRFTSPKTLATIHFMRTSLVELYCLNQPMAYKLAFIFIRNMATHLRNAINTPKMEKLRIVYNWPFIHSIHFLGDLLAKTHPSSVLQPLIYPWTQIVLGTMSLQKSSKYFPLVFHLANILTEVSLRTSVFIPVLTPLLEVLQYKGLKMAPRRNASQDGDEEPFSWATILKVSGSQMKDQSFTDGIVDQLYNSILAYLNVECSTIGFPEMVYPAVVQIKSFLKSCKNPGHSKKMKQLLEKIQENSAFITQRRKDVPFGVADAKAVKDWEIATRQSDPPIHAFYKNWEQISSRKKPQAPSKAKKAEESPDRAPHTAEDKILYEDDQGEDDDAEDATEGLGFSGPEDILGQFAASEDEEDDYANQEGSDDGEPEESPRPKKAASKKFAKRPRKNLDAEDNAPPRKKRMRTKPKKKSNFALSKL